MYCCSRKDSRIEYAVFNHGLKFFVIAPEGRQLAEVFSSTVHPGIALTAFGYDLPAIFQKGLAGASRRGLREIFGGEDELAMRKLVRFLES